MITLVLLPGMNGSSRLFAPFLEALRQQAPALRVIAVSYPSDRAMDYTQLAAFVEPLLPVDQPYVLLGESFSGPLAVMLAADNPAGLAGLVLCGTFCSNPAPGLRALGPFLKWLPLHSPPLALLRLSLMDSTTSAQTQATLKTDLAALAPGVLQARLVAVISVDVHAALARIRVPVLYLRALRDRLIPRAIAQQLRAALPAMQITDFDAPHLLLQTRPQEAAARVLEFAPT